MDITSNELFNAIQYTLDNNSLVKGYIDGLSSRLKNEWNMSYKMDDVLNVHSNVQTNDRVLQLKCVNFEKDKDYNHMDLKLADDNIHMIFYHQNSLKDTRYYKTNASISIKTFTKDNLYELKKYIEKLE